jgi:tetratricopeptide (TPR) repeat protein
MRAKLVVPVRALGYPRVILSVLAIAVLGIAIYWSLRLAYADYLFQSGSKEAMARALRLAPGNPAYHARWAEAAPEHATEALETAVRLNPSDSASWTELGLRLEERKDLARAERCLLVAARVDKTFAPRWKLAEYYFRRQDKEKFWHWMREALLMSYDDVSPLFQLCWQVTQDPQTILNRAIPDRTQVLEQYAGFLIAEERLAAAQPVIDRLVERGSTKSADLLLRYCDRLLEARQTAAAVRNWNLMCDRRLAQCRSLSPERGISLTNGDFAIPPRSRGFDWRLQSIPGISVSQRASPPELTIIFSGDQPESCEILSQLLPLAPSSRYRFGFHYETSHIAPDTGLRWSVMDADSDAELMPDSPHLSAAGGKDETVLFSASGRTELARLALRYHRAPGTMRIAGWISLRNLKLDFAR